jgi:phenylacetic acid degradation protein PaaD
VTSGGADELARRCGAAMYGRDVAAQALGITLDSIAPGHSRMRMTVREDMLNGHGVCHGGIIFTLADTAFAYACNSRNAVTLAQNCSIDFVSAARAGDVLVADAAEHHQFSRTGLYDVTVTRAEDGQVVARFRGRSYRVRGMILPSGEGPEPG